MPATLHCTRVNRVHITGCSRFLVVYRRPEEVLPYKCGPTEALGFTKRCADLCIEAMGSSQASIEAHTNGGSTNGGSQPTEGTSRKLPLRAMDVGCSVGGVTFELT